LTVRYAKVFSFREALTPTKRSDSGSLWGSPRPRHVRPTIARFDPAAGDMYSSETAVKLELRKVWVLAYYGADYGTCD